MSKILNSKEIYKKAWDINKKYRKKYNRLLYDMHKTGMKSVALELTAEEVAEIAFAFSHCRTLEAKYKTEHRDYWEEEFPLLQEVYEQGRNDGSV